MIHLINNILISVSTSQFPDVDKAVASQNIHVITSCLKLYQMLVSNERKRSLKLFQDVPGNIFPDSQKHLTTPLFTPQKQQKPNSGSIQLHNKNQLELNIIKPVWFGINQHPAG